MMFLNKIQFLAMCKKISYWKKQEKRWNYISSAIDMASSLHPSSILELGNMGVSIAEESHTMDIMPTPGINYLFDATAIPWPIADKAYDVFIALQVFEHLDDARIKQKSVFNEACRVSRNVIMSIPFMWHNSKLKNHNNITDKIVMDWCSMRKPSRTVYFPGKFGRKIYLWRNVQP